MARPDVAKRSGAIEKSESRWVAEHSMRNSIAYMISVGITHFITGSPVNGVHTKPEEMSEGARMFYDIIKEQNDGEETIHVL